MPAPQVQSATANQSSGTPIAYFECSKCGERLVSWGWDCAIRFWSLDGAEAHGGVRDAHTGKINGVVLNDQQQPVNGAIVALVPELRFRTHSELYKSTTTDSSGNFNLEGIAPGDSGNWMSLETGYSFIAISRSIS